jgi:hypothetical protein
MNAAKIDDRRFAHCPLRIPPVNQPKDYPNRPLSLINYRKRLDQLAYPRCARRRELLDGNISKLGRVAHDLPLDGNGV